MDITKFVDATISRRLDSNSIVVGIRPALLIGLVTTTTSTDHVTGLINKIFTSTQDILDYTIMLSGVDTAVFSPTDELFLEAEAYFRAGGLQLRLAILNNTTDIQDTVLSSRDTINFKIVPTKLAIATYDKGTYTLANALTTATTINGNGVDNVIGINNKILYYDLTMTEWGGADTTNIKSVEGLVVSLVNDINDMVSVKAMAYVTNQNFKSTNIKELLYTNLVNTNVLRTTSTQTMEDIMSAIGYGNPINNLNFNAYMNITPGVNALLGGKDTSGHEVVSRQNAIAVQEDLTNQLLTYLITRKPTFSSTTISETYNLLSDYLDKVLLSGWITPQRVYDEDAKSVVKNGISYKLLNRGELLEYGYKVVILPFSRADIVERVFRDIYVFLGTTKGIQTIVLKGDLL